jgi:arylsulfatase A-like enzyme
VSRPNLIYLMADQLGYNHVGYAGNPRAKTPNIDRLAGESVSFTNAVSNTPVCAAHRAGLFTGKYTTSTGMVINELRMNPNHRCLGHVVTEAGYQTAYIGKWHLWANQLGNHHDPANSFTPRGPCRLGWDGFWASYGFHHTYWDMYYHTESREKITIPGYEPDGQTDLAIDWLRGAREDNRPFSLVLSYGTPHDPWGSDNVPKEYWDLFEDVQFSLPENYLPDNDPYADKWGSLRPEERERLTSWMRGYYAMTANLDANIGRLLAAVEDLALAKDTIVVFSSDHGEMFGAHGRRAKNIFYEEAARVPFLVRWTGRSKPGLRSDACISTVDIMPTLLGLMRLPVPEEVEGMDLSHLVLGEDGPEPEAALLQNTGACAAWEDGHEWRALRDKRYTYARYRVDDRELLFDNIEDPLQVRNLAGDPDYAAVLERFRTMLSRRMAELNDDFAPSTWYRDNWIEDRCIRRTATLPPR